MIPNDQVLLTRVHPVIVNDGQPFLLADGHAILAQRPVEALRNGLQVPGTEQLLVAAGPGHAEALEPGVHWRRLRGATSPS